MIRLKKDAVWWFAILLILFCFFPFVGPNLGTDTQPFALIIAFAVIICSYRKKIAVDVIKYKKYILVSLLLLMGWGFISATCIPFFDVAKRMFSYFSFFLIPLAAFFAIKKVGEEKFQTLLKACIIIWGFVGIVQLLFDRTFLSFLVPLYRTSANRGVCSLASEPSFYGYMCFFMLLFSFDLKKDNKIYGILLLVQMVLFAQSTVTLIYLAVLIAIYFIYSFLNKKNKNILLLVGLAICGAFALGYMMTSESGTRIVYLVRSFLEHGFEIIERDESVFERVTSMMQSFSAYGIPQFIGKDTLMSGFGGMFYELGWFSLIIIAYTIKIIRKSDKLGMVYALTLCICMFSAIQLSAPILGLYLGWCLFKEEQR